MARSKEGQVLERPSQTGRRYALRVIAYGERHYVTLGGERDGWTRKAAEEELANIAADVRRGTWVPPAQAKAQAAAVAPATEEPEAGPTFHRFASDYLAGRQGEVSDRMHEYLRWALVLHLIPHFAQTPVDAIDIEAVDAYRRLKVAEAEELATAIRRKKPVRNERGQVRKPLSPGSINKTIDVLTSVLALAVEYKHLTANPATGRRRRLKPPGRRPVHLDTAAQIQALLDAAGIMDRSTSRWATDRRPSIATLVLAGPRAGEHARLLWRDVDLANSRIHIGRSKTQAGLREIRMLPALRDELAAHKTTAPSTRPDDLVFPTLAGNRRDKDNLRTRVLEPVLPLADKLLIRRGETPLPAGVTPHKLRHTFASILVACGEDPASVMAQLGHTDPQFTLRIYTHLMRRDPAERQCLEALVHGQPLPAPDAPLVLKEA